MKRHKGFTLIEVAIVTAIIGLLIVGVIRGESLIQDAKVSSAITLAQDISVAANAFKQQYHLLPGDIAITTEISNVRTECLSTGSNAGNNDGLINATESICVPEVLFKAGLAKVDQNAGWAIFQTSYGPVRVIATRLSNVSSGFAPSVTHVIEFANLPCDVVQEMDRKMDNDDLASGKAIASSGTCTAGSIVPYYAVALW